MEKNNVSVTTDASVVRTSKSETEKLDACGVYHIECYDINGNLKWTECARNLVTYQGKNAMLDTYFAGSAYTATWYMSLITAGTATTASTYASPTVTEIATGIISGNTRPTVGWSASAAGSKSATTTVFSITAAATITGNMLVTGSNTVADTAVTGGILFSAANFSSPKTVGSGDTLNVTYSISV